MLYKAESTVKINQHSQKLRFNKQAAYTTTYNPKLRISKLMIKQDTRAITKAIKLIITST